MKGERSGEDTKSGKGNPSETRATVCMISHTKISRDARVSRTAQALLEAGYRLHLICLDNRIEPQLPRGLEEAALYPIRDLLEAFPPSGLGRLLRGGWARFPLFYLKSLWHGFRCWPAIVHCHDLNVLPIGYVLRWLCSSKLVYDSHEVFTEKVGLRAKWFWRRLEKLLIYASDVLITTTEARAEFLCERYPGIKKPLVLHNYPISRRGRWKDIRRLAGLPPDAFVALYQGGVQAHRGLEAIIESARYADEVYFVIQGDGPLFEKISQLASNSPASRRIRLLPGGVYGKLRQFTPSADVGLQVLSGISINHTTTLSNKLFEYIHAGLPVVASDFCMIRRYVERYQFGLLVNPDDPRQIAQALLRLRQNRGTRARLAEKAREASRILNWENERGRLFESYAALGRHRV